MKNRKSSQQTASRRAFLRGSLTAAGAGAVALAAQKAAATAVMEPAADAKEQEQKKHEGYHETSHIRDYYKTARS